MSYILFKKSDKRKTYFWKLFSNRLKQLLEKLEAVIRMFYGDQN